MYTLFNKISSYRNLEKEIECHTIIELPVSVVLKHDSACHARSHDLFYL